MAKPLYKITKTQFSKEYNITEVLIDKTSIMKKLETFNPNKQVVAFGVKKTPRDATPIWFKEYEQRINQRFDQIDNRLTQIVQANNLVDPTQKN
ncbi:MAG: hypothetical protein MJ201_05480 [Mycoplasmoidaceae bacterium]|nr:hypothetical protein [Mycoplasmoidaceae bacterium]